MRIGINRCTTIAAAGGVRLRGNCRERNPANNAADTYYEYRDGSSSGWHHFFFSRLLYLAVGCLHHHLYLCSSLSVNDESSLRALLSGR